MSGQVGVASGRATFRMLGELQVVDGDVDLPIRGAKQRALPLLLLVRARETVQAERLADELLGR